MTAEPIEFSYTGDPSVYRNAALAMGFLILAEGGIVLLLILLLVPGIWLKLLSAVVLVSLLAWAAQRMTSVRKTSHRLTGDELLLAYGSFQARIPRPTMAAARPAAETVSGLQVLGPQADQSRKRLTVCFSETGQVLLTLTQAQTFRTGFGQSVQAQQILLNVDQQAQLLAALALPESPTEPNATALSDQALGPTLPRPDRIETVRAQPQDQTHRPITLRTENLTRTFGSVVAVDGLTLSLRSGEIYGFLGPNGAGKTTTIKMLAGLLAPSGGQAWIGNNEITDAPEAAKRALGFVPDHSLLYSRLTGREFLRFLAQMRGLEKRVAEQEIESLLTMLELQDRADDLCGDYSFGMARKLSLAGALLHHPQVLILDEPLNGLDPRSARRLKDLFLDLAQTGCTIFLSTHDLATAEAVCHRIGIIHRGQLQAEGSAHELRAWAAAPSLEGVFLRLTEDKRGDQHLDLAE